MAIWCRTCGKVIWHQTYKGMEEHILFTTQIVRGNPLLTKERNVVFNNTLNTFYLWLYGIRHMVKDHSDSDKGNLLPPHRLLLLINSKGSFISTIPQTG